jgi:hypothetical protein
MFTSLAGASQLPEVTQGYYGNIRDITDITGIF